MPVELSANLAALEQSPLKLALVQVRVPPLFAVDRPNEVERLAGSLSEDWALVDERRAQRVELQLTATGVGQAASEPERVWRFEADDGRFVATLATTSIAVETRDYGNFDEFQVRLAGLLNQIAATSAFSPRFVSRLGVRYVNELQDARLASDQHRVEVVNPELLGPGVSLGTDLLASLQELRFQQADGVLAVRHGLTAPDEYLLDVDHYRDERGPFEVEPLTTTVRAWHDTIEGVFAWGFEPWLRGQGVEP